MTSLVPNDTFLLTVSHSVRACLYLLENWQVLNVFWRVLNSKLFVPGFGKIYVNEQEFCFKLTRRKMCGLQSYGFRPVYGIFANKCGGGGGTPRFVTGWYTHFSPAYFRLPPIQRLVKGFKVFFQWRYFSKPWSPGNDKCMWREGWCGMRRFIYHTRRVYSTGAQSQHAAAVVRWVI